MAERPDHIAEDDIQYRRGLVLGLTMAEVMILVLFCLLLTTLYLLAIKDKKIEALGGKSDRVFLVSTPILKQIESRFQQVSSQAEIDDAFQKLLVSQADSEIVENTIKDSGVKFEPTATTEDKVRAVTDVTKVARDTVADSGRPASTSHEVQEGMEAVRKEQYAYIGAKSIGSIKDGAARSKMRSAIAGALCEAEYSDPRQRAECQKKIVALAGGKGLELQSCWWDKTTTPWKTKGIFDVAVTDQGFILREQDPGTEEYRAQKTTLPIRQIQLGSELSESSFLSQTADLLAWSDRNKCRFFVRLFDQTGPQAKSIWQARVDALERRFYKERTARTFVGN